MMAFALIMFIGGVPVHMASFSSIQECHAAVNHNQRRIYPIGHLGCIHESRINEVVGR